MKIILLITLFCFISIIFVEAGGVKFENPIDYDDFESLFQAVTRFIFWMIVAIFPIIILVAAIQLFGAGDDPKKIESAKNIIKWAVIGFAIVLSATALYNLIIGIINPAASLPATPP